MYRPPFRSTGLALGILGLLSSAVADTAPEAPSPLRVAVYADQGASRSRSTLLTALEQFKDFQVETVTVEEIRAGKLAGFQVLIQPGGSGGGQGRALGEEGREKIREFVRGGGGYVGICAGAYLATCDYPWSLRILDAKVIDKAHWARGNGDTVVGLSETGRKVLGVTSQRETIVYWQGPLLAPAGDPEVPDYEPLGTYESEIAQKGAPSGVMIGTTAIASGRFGMGRVLCFSPHPEKTPSTHSLLTSGLKWVSGPPD